MMIHGSPVNSSSGRRLGFTCQFITPRVHFRPMEYSPEITSNDFRRPVLVQGEDSVGSIKYAKTKDQMMEEAQE